MKNYLFGFIGAGNMGGALAKAAAKSTKEILICDKDSEKAKSLADDLGCDVGDIVDVVKNCTYIFLGVKPQMMADMLSSVSEELQSREDVILVSMAAGLSIDTIKKMAGKDFKVIRIMPNTPVSVGLGEILYSKSENTTDEELAKFIEIMKGAGALTKIDESLMDAGCSVSGCGPAFVYMFIKSLAQGGAECGIDYDTSLQLAAQTVLGSAKLLIESGIDPDTLKQNVCSPGGSTIEGVKSLENSGLEDTVIKAVKSSYRRNIELGAT